jgi:hypothetical protein
MPTYWSINIPRVLAVILVLLLGRDLVWAQPVWAQGIQEKAEQSQIIQLSEEEQKTVQSVFEAMRFREMEARGAAARLDAARNAYLAVIYKLLSDNGLRSSEYELSQDMKSFMRKTKKSEVPLSPQRGKE